MNNEIKLGKTNAVMTVDTIGKLTMPADTGRETKKAFVAVEAGNKANLELCKALARIKTTESYKEVYNADGVNVTPTFGDFAEVVLNMSKSGASGYASVGEVFGELLDNGYKYGHFVLMLKLRKVLDENGNPLDGEAIVNLCEDHGATPEISTRKLDEIIKTILCEDNGQDEEAEDEDGDGEQDDEDGDENDADELDKAFKVIRSKATDAGVYDKVNKLIVELEKIVKGV